LIHSRVLSQDVYAAIPYLKR